MKTFVSLIIKVLIAQLLWQGDGIFAFIFTLQVQSEKYSVNGNQAFSVQL